MYHWKITFEAYNPIRGQRLTEETGVVAATFAEAVEVFAAVHWEAGTDVLQVVRTGMVETINLAVKKEW